MIKMNYLIHFNHIRMFLFICFLSFLDKLSILKLMCTSSYNVNIIVIYHSIRIIIAEYGYGLNLKSLV